VEPAAAKAGKRAVTITTATFLVSMLASRVLIPSRSIMDCRPCLVMGTLRKESPVPLRPTTRPWPMSSFSRTPSKLTMSLMRDLAAAGSTIDVSVSSAGDAKSLLGGTLLTTPLMGATGEVYAVAQGTVQTGAVSAGGASGSSVTRGVPTSGRIAGGAEIEKEVDFKLASLENMRLTLRNPDFTTALRVAEVINRAYPGTASAENGTIVTLRLPKDGNFVTFLSSIEQLEVEPDTLAKVIINEVDGVVVMTSDVRVSTVAIAQGNLTITINERPQVSQPAPFSQGQTTVTPQSTIKVDEEKGKKFITLNSGTSLAVLVKGLNALGVSPRDMISILQSIKTAGALQADIEVQ
jgi:flagellar P-ring protein FlgI